MYLSLWISEYLMFLLQINVYNGKGEYKILCSNKWVSVNRGYNHRKFF